MVDFNKELTRYKTELEELDRLLKGQLNSYSRLNYDDAAMRQLWSRRATIRSRIDDLEGKTRKDPNDPQTRLENLVALRNLDIARRQNANINTSTTDNLQAALDVAAINAANKANEKYGVNTITEDDMKTEYRPSYFGERADIVRNSLGSNALDPFSIGRNQAVIENQYNQRIMNETIRRLGGEVPSQTTAVSPQKNRPLTGEEVIKAGGGNWVDSNTGDSTVYETITAPNGDKVIPITTGFRPTVTDVADIVNRSVVRDSTTNAIANTRPTTVKTEETKTSSPKTSTTATTTVNPKPTQVQAQPTPVQVGAREYYIPSNGFTSGAVTIDPVTPRGDNGGLQHAAMNALYQPSDAPMSLGQLIAFSSILNGKKDFGGLADVTATMQNADKMNAYAAQQNIANEVQRLMAGGRSAEEARYEALTNQLLANGQDRSAVSTTIPEYAKQADIRAARELDAINAMGGDYTARGAFGYTPYGVRSLTTNADGSRNVNINGTTLSNVPSEYANFGVYGAVKGDGSGTKSATEYGINFDKQRMQNEINVAKVEAEVAKLNAIANGANVGTGTRNQLSSLASIASQISKALGPEAAMKYLLESGVNVPMINPQQNSSNILGVSVGVGNPGVD